MGKYLNLLNTKPEMRFDKHKLTKQVSAIPIDIAQSLGDFDLRFFWSYKIFPENILSAATQWELEKREMKIGDIVAQQIYLPPFQPLSFKLMFGVKITELITEDKRVGFSYTTLEGHVEKGISTFLLEEKEHNLTFTIQTYSAPGSLLTRLVAPIFSRPYQAYCTKRALQNVKRQMLPKNQLKNLI